MKRLLPLALVAWAFTAPAQSANPARIPAPTVHAGDFTVSSSDKDNSRGRLLWVSPRGNDATARRGSRIRAWKTAYDIYDASNHVYYGAITAARSGDWIVFEPGTYCVPSIPLNLPGNGRGRGVNLFVPRGATIIRTNFSNTNDLPLAASLTACGPLIIPGNGSQVIIEGTVIATNNPAFDAVLGWLDWLNRFNVWRSGLYGFTNWVPNGVVLDGHGTLIGNSDVIYVSSVVTGVPGSITCRNVHLRSQWDCLYFSGRNSIETSRIDAYATAEMSTGSHGIIVTAGGNWVDDGSTLAASGTTGVGYCNAAAWVLGSTNRFRNTRLIAYGETNVVPFISENSISSGWYLSYTDKNRCPDLIVLDRSARHRPIH